MQYFTENELKCKCGCGQLEYSSTLLDLLDEVRAEFGKPIIVNSCYRCSEHNNKIGGAKNSRHMHGHAVDLRISSMGARFNMTDYQYCFQLVKLLCKYNVSVLIYSSFIHIQLDDVPMIRWMK